MLEDWKGKNRIIRERILMIAQKNQGKRYEVKRTYMYIYRSVRKRTREEKLLLRFQLRIDIGDSKYGLRKECSEDRKRSWMYHY